MEVSDTELSQVIEDMEEAIEEGNDVLSMTSEQPQRDMKEPEWLTYDKSLQDNVMNDQPKTGEIMEMVMHTVEEVTIIANQMIELNNATKQGLSFAQ